MKKTIDGIKKIFTHSKGALVAAILCVVTVILVGSFFVYTVAYTRILPNTLVGGMNVGGMTVEDAEREIEDSFKDIAKGRSVSIRCCNNEKTIAFDELNTYIDSKKTAERAFDNGRQKGILGKTLKMLTLAFRPQEVGIEVSLDEEVLNNLISELAKGNEIPPAETDYVLDGNELTIVRGHDGKMVDRRLAKEKIAMAATKPGTKTVSLEIQNYEAKTADADAFYDKVTAPVKDAEYILKDGEIRVEPEKVGIKVEKSKIKEALKSGQDRYTITVETEQPNVTAKDLEELLFRDTLGSFASSFATSTQARASNVILTANRINAKILMPGDVFSYDQAIGRRTAANGYKEAGVYIGNKVESGIGGGICQTSSTLYSAALYANLEIVSRTSHSLPVSYVPLGQDATIAEGYIDLKIKNNTNYPIKIVATVNGRRLTCSILGVKDPKVSVEIVNTIVSESNPQTERTENAEVPKGYKRILNKGAKGYTVASKRIVRESGKVIKTETLTRSVYRAAPVEEEVNPLDKDTPTGELKIYTPGMVIPEEEAQETEKVPETDAKPEEGKPSVEEDEDKPENNEEEKTTEI
ncbi:MAG: VanW family protein [Clostridia bacterium]|nr:VanW family protein [Clostridia bacterium]